MELNDIEIKNRLVVLLRRFDDICEKNGLRYSLGYGTLIGAMRHKGFIPWDDDIDVIMPQDDYIKFLELACFRQQDSNSKVILYEPDNKSIQYVNYCYPFAKLIDNETYITSDFFREIGGLWIDIFPITGLPGNKNEIESLFNVQYSLHRKLAAAHRYRNLKTCSPVVFFKQVRCNYYFKMHKQLVKEMKSLSFSYPFNLSENVANSIWGYGKKEIMPRKWFEEYIDIEFEGHVFKGLRCYNEFLYQIYGDWDKMPPEDKRIAHHYYKAFLKEEL